MRRIVACAFLAALLPVLAVAGKPKCAVRVHVEANATDGEVYSSQAASPRTGRPVVIEKIPTISENDVTGCAIYPAADGSYGALFQLNDHGKLALDTLSVERRGRFVYVFVNGRGLAELQIDKRITDGKLYLASGLTAQDVELMKKTWPTRTKGRK
jgi:hypothetical protein